MSLLPMRDQVRLWGKRLLFPGLDLNTRCRDHFLPRFFRKGPIDTLDAGCGNGALSYAAYRSGNRVLGVTMDEGQIQKAREYFSFLGTDPDRLRFEVCNLYDLPKLGSKFDQIICSETLEHITRDQLVVQYFHDLLKEGGVLHLCCPFSEHRLNKGQVCADESVGWHVRDGYTLGTYKALVEPLGFRIVRSVGLGTPFLASVAHHFQILWNRTGFAVALPVFLLIWPLQLLDYMNPSTPLSLYVECVKVSQELKPGGQRSADGLS